MNNQENIKKEINLRFSYFRKEYISKKQKDAAKLLNISPSALCNLESGTRSLNYRIISKLIGEPYYLNSNWLATGEGNPQVKKEFNPPPLLTDFSDLTARIAGLENYVRLLDSNIRKLFELVAKQGKSKNNN